jgi:hypothetical protein
MQKTEEKKKKKKKEAGSLGQSCQKRLWYAGKERKCE